jgi:hypothetical protein
MTLSFFFLQVTLLSNPFFGSLAAELMCRVGCIDLRVPVVAANCKAVGFLERTPDAADDIALTSQDHIFCLVSFVVDDQTNLSSLSVHRDDPPISRIVVLDQHSPVRWLGFKESQDWRYGSRAGTTQFSANNMDYIGFRGNSGFSTNSRVD